MHRVVSQAFGHEPVLREPSEGKPYAMPCAARRMLTQTAPRPEIVSCSGGDTCLMVEVECDYTYYGDGCKFDGGKTLRDDMRQSTFVTSSEALDTVITNALILDAMVGIIKADVGIKGTNKIVEIGKAGNHDMMDKVDMIVGVTTDVIVGEGLILTAGGIDTHCHWICPHQVEKAIALGITTMFGGDTGHSAGTSATTCMPAPSQVEMMLLATDEYPLNFFSGKREYQ